MSCCPQVKRTPPAAVSPDRGWTIPGFEAYLLPSELGQDRMMGAGFCEHHREL